MAFQSRDSVVDLSSFLEEHHDRHNPALDGLDEPEADIPLLDSSSDSTDSTTSSAGDPLQDAYSAWLEGTTEEDYYYEFDPTTLTNNKRAKKTWLGCLFPWLSRQPIEEEESHVVSITQPVAVIPVFPNNLKRENSEDSDTSSDTGKGILKKHTRDVTEDSSQRRAIFQRVYSSAELDHADDICHIRAQKVHFADMAHVNTVGKHWTNGEEKAKLWWQRTDYKEFRMENLLITKASSMLLGSNDELVLHRSMRHNPRLPPQDPELNWWCRFGHSRRGLEHQTSPEEGQERKERVHWAVRRVLSEQQRRRQHSSKDDAHNPEERIRQIYQTSSTWARELGLATAAADAAAVRSIAEEQEGNNQKEKKQSSAYPKHIFNKNTPSSCTSGRNYFLTQRKHNRRLVDAYPFFMKRLLYPALLPRSPTSPRTVVPAASALFI